MATAWTRQAEEELMMEPAKVALEGIAPDLTCANGAYGVQAEYALDSEGALLSFFRRIQFLDRPAAMEGCPPAVTLEAGGKVYRFQLGGGRIFSEETETDVTPDQILDLVRTPAMAGEARRFARGRGAVNPRAVRFPHLPPTKKNLFDYDTGAHQPQVAFRIYRTASDRWGPLFVTLFVIPPTGLVAVLALTGGETGIGVSVALVTVGLVAWVSHWMGRRHRAFRMGFDWGENVLWSEWGRSASAIPGLEKHVSYVPDANLVVSVDLLEEWEWSGSGEDESRHRCWQLVARNVDGVTSPIGPKIYTRKEARRVLEAASALLSAQR